jgi:polysaccharide biosynthesis/export protein
MPGPQTLRMLAQIMVSGMTLDFARQTIEQRVAKQLIGSRVSVTMGNLRSIRVFVLGRSHALLLQQSPLF